ncbi:MAG TPA: hypothetical protein PKM50_01165 [Methanoregula sp.]|nr:hypothetical protein [Methanoregula sp.]
MTGPYLKSGESIILTTDRVFIEDIEYDMILTSQRLALVDSGHTSDQPQVIPFATILSVKGGTTPAREPFITLTVIDPIGLEDNQTLDLVFSLQPYEDRSAERDLWVQKLIEHIVSVRQEPPLARKQQVPEKSQGMNPSVRRWVAPDMPQPHSQVTEKAPRPSEELLSAIQKTTIITTDDSGKEPAPDETEYPEHKASPEIPEYSETEAAPFASEEIVSGDSTRQEEPVEQTITETARADEEIQNTPVQVLESEPAKTGTQPVDETELPSHPGETEKSAPEKEEGFQKLIPTTESVETEETSQSGNAAGISDAEKREQNPVLNPEIILKQPVTPPAPEIPAVTMDKGHTELPEGTAPAQPVENKTEKLDFTAKTPVPAESAPAIPDEHGLSHPEPTIQTGLPDTVVFPVISTSTIPGKPEKPVKTMTSDTPAPEPQGNAPAPQPGKIPTWALVTSIITTLVIIAGVVVIFWHPAGYTGGPAPEITPVQTSQPVSTTAPVVVQSTGVWVKVVYNGTFVGTYGNPGTLKQVRGKEEQVYTIKDPHDLVQASFTKQDDSGNVLTVEVYNNGNMIKQVTKSAPRATISILVDPYTGDAPYIPVTTFGE